MKAVCIAYTCKDLIVDTCVGCHVLSGHSLYCHHSSLSQLVESVSSNANYTISTITISHSNVSYLPDNVFAQYLSVSEVKILIKLTFFSAKYVIKSWQLAYNPASCQWVETSLQNAGQDNKNSSELSLHVLIQSLALFNFWAISPKNVQKILYDQYCIVCIFQQGVPKMLTSIRILCVLRACFGTRCIICIG